MKRRCPQQCSVMKKRRSLQNEEERNWLDLPQDVMFLIFNKLGVVEILLHAQKVCFLWRKLARDPFLYQSLEFMDFRKYFRFHPKFAYIFKEAVDRSCGKLTRLTSDDLLNERLLHYVNFSNSNSLRCLHLGDGTYVSEYGLAQVMEGLPLLEEFELWLSHFPKLVIEEVGRSCPKLTTFRFCQRDNRTSFDDDASAIAFNMPRLRYLGWIGSRLTNKGMSALVDGCSSLQYLHLRHSYGRKITKSLWKKRCATKKISLVLPDESSFGIDAVSVLVNHARVRKNGMKW